MKINLKVAIGLALIVCCTLYIADFYWQSYKEQKQRSVKVINLNNFMSEIDCAKPANSVEAMICYDDSLLQLEQELAVAFRNNSLLTFWEFNHELEKREGAPCIKNCLFVMDKLQQEWISNVRNRCKSVECINQVTKDRIAQLNGQSEPLPTFNLDENRDTGMCNALLEVLNRAPREQLGDCMRYDFTGSPFSQETTKLSSEYWQKAEEFQDKKRQMLDGKNTKSSGDFAELWPALQKKYGAGVRELYGTQENDSQELPRYLEVRYPSYACQTLPYGTRMERGQQQTKIRNRLKQADSAELLLHAQNHGWESLVLAPFAGQTGSIYSGQLIYYNQEWFVLDQSQLNRIIGPESIAISKTAIYLKKIYPDINLRKSMTQDNMCSYWYNY